MTPLDIAHLAGPGSSTTLCGQEYRYHLVVCASPGEITCPACLELWRRQVQAVPK